MIKYHLKQRTSTKIYFKVGNDMPLVFLKYTSCSLNDYECKICLSIQDVNSVD